MLVLYNIIISSDSCNLSKGVKTLQKVVDTLNKESILTSLSRAFTPTTVQDCMKDFVNFIILVV